MPKLTLICFIIILCFSIFTEERLERLTKQINSLDFDSPVGCDIVETFEEKADSLPLVDGELNKQNGAVEASQSSERGDISQSELQNSDQSKKEQNGNIVSLDPEIASWVEPVVDSSVGDNSTTKPSPDRRLPNSVLPLLRFQHCESSDSSPRYITSVVQPLIFIFFSMEMSAYIGLVWFQDWIISSYEYWNL